MKGLLEFNLPEEQSEFRDAQNGSGYLGVIQEFDNYLRSVIKYESDGLSKEELSVYEKVRERLYEEMNSAGYTIWE